MSELNDKQQRFCDEYLIDLNATQAAIRAGYSPKTAEAQSSRLLTNVKVKAFIEQAKQQRSERTKIDADWLLQRLAAEATADLADLYNADGSLKPVHEWPDIWRTGLVSGVEIEDLFDGHGEDRTHIGYIKKVKLCPRIKRLELIGRHVKVDAFRDRMEHTGKNGAPIQYEQLPATKDQVIAKLKELGLPTEIYEK